MSAFTFAETCEADAPSTRKNPAGFYPYSAKVSAEGKRPRYGINFYSDTTWIPDQVRDDTNRHIPLQNKPPNASMGKFIINRR